MKRMTYRLEDQYGNPTDSIILESDLIFLNSSEKWKKVLSRLAAIEDILGDEYDLDRLSVLCNQRITMRKEVSERFSLTAKIPLDRLREIAEAERDGRCVVLPRLEPGQGDPIGDKGVEGLPGLCPNCNDYRGLVWDKVTGCSRCTICGWTNAKT